MGGRADAGGCGRAGGRAGVLAGGAGGQEGAQSERHVQSIVFVHGALQSTLSQYCVQHAMRKSKLHTVLINCFHLFLQSCASTSRSSEMTEI